MSSTKSPEDSEKAVPCTIDDLSKQYVDMDKDDAICIGLDDEVFSPPNNTVYLFRDDILQFCRMEEISISAVVLYQGYIDFTCLILIILFYYCKT